MHVEEACATCHSSIILISLRVEVAQISNFLVCLNLAALKSFFQLKFTTLYTGRERRRSFFFLTKHRGECSALCPFLGWDPHLQPYWLTFKSRDQASHVNDSTMQSLRKWRLAANSS